MIPAITVRQPWAGLIFESDPKDVENRQTNIVGAYRGPLAIHAGRQCDPEIIDLWNYQRSVILGVVQVVGVHLSDTCRGPAGPAGITTCSKWADLSPVHIQIADPIRLPEPIPYREGRLGRWLLPADVEAEVLRQIGAQTIWGDAA